MIEPTKTLVIANPASRGGWLGKHWHTLSKKLREALGPVELQLTEYVGHGKSIAERAARGGIETIVSFGGDGTHSEISDGVVTSGRGTEVSLGIVHAGTGGDFRKMIPNAETFEGACEVIRTQPAATVDVGWVRYLHDEGDYRERHFLNITSLGMGGLVDRMVAKSTKRFGGKFAYLSATLRSNFQYKPARVEMRIDGKDLGVFDISSICVCNGQWAGGGMHFAPNARLSDGIFDVVVIRAASIIRGGQVLRALYSGKHLDEPEVSFFQGKRIDVDVLEHRAWMDIDGEAPGVAPASFEIRPNAVRVIGIDDAFL